MKKFVGKTMTNGSNSKHYAFTELGKSFVLLATDENVTIRDFTKQFFARDMLELSNLAIKFNTVILNQKDEDIKNLELALTGYMAKYAVVTNKDGERVCPYTINTKSRAMVFGTLHDKKLENFAKAIYMLMACLFTGTQYQPDEIESYVSEDEIAEKMAKSEERKAKAKAKKLAEERVKKQEEDDKKSAIITNLANIIAMLPEDIDPRIIDMLNDTTTLVADL